MRQVGISRRALAPGSFDEPDASALRLIHGDSDAAGQYGGPAPQGSEDKA